MISAPQRSVLFVHAHPDDETVGTGATMAHYARTGARVVLVTCTLGEEGEVQVPRLAGLVAARADQLGGYRIAELNAACAALGVADHRFLGGAGRYRDSGMMGLPTNDDPRSFWSADLTTASDYLLAVIDEVRPQVVVTYDPNGLYGHPDHIQAHRVTMRAVELAAARGFGPNKVYWTALSRDMVAAGLAALRDAPDSPFAGPERVEDLPFVVGSDLVTAEIDGRAVAGAKLAALRAHATQIPADSWLMALAGNVGDRFFGLEHFQLACGQRGPGSGPHTWETDLFAGLPVAP